MKTRKERTVSADLKRRVEVALSSPVLRRALADFSARYVRMRLAALDGLDFESLRDEVVAAKEVAISQREQLRREFSDALAARGAVVHFAADAAEANRLIIRLLSENSVRRVVKTKSITSEEIGLNKALQAAGLEVTETDLGEWIVQLAGHAPSHMVIPAIHMDRRQVADLFRDRLAEEVPEDIGGMVKLARRHLRRALLEAEAAVTGANLAVASTGTIAILTNEGNGGLATCLAPLHIVLLGIDKILADWPAAMAVLKALPPSATGQKMSSYVTFLTGPAAGKLHVILLDNGREEMARSADFRQALRCLRCGACLNVCPVYRIVGGQAFSRVYMGGIGTILTAFVHDLDSAVAMASLCAGCRACATVCPARIDIPFLIDKVAAMAVERRGLGMLESIILRGAMGDRSRYHALLTAAGKANRLLADRGGMLRGNLLPSTQFRRLPAVAPKPYREQCPKSGSSDGARGEVVLFAGCVADFVYPEMLRAAEKVLASIGIRLIMPRGQGCCGLPAHRLGDEETARRQAADACAALGECGGLPIITVCPTCLYSIRHLWPRLLSGTAQWRAAERLASYSSGISSFLSARAERLRFRAMGMKIAYHDSCHLKNAGEGEELAARRLLALAGAEIAETGESRCCGFGGTFSLKQPGVSEKMLSEKIEALKGTGAMGVAADCPGCVMQIRGAMAAQGQTARVSHTIEYLAEALFEPAE